MKIKEANLLDETEGILVHGCNTGGVMGAGIARSIREKFPKAFSEYRRLYKARGLHPGDVQLVQVAESLFICNAMTQVLGETTDYKAVWEAFQTLNRILQDSIVLGKMPVKFPLIGAGIGGGNWPFISFIINNSLNSSIDRTLFILPGVKVPTV